MAGGTEERTTPAADRIPACIRRALAGSAVWILGALAGCGGGDRLLATVDGQDGDAGASEAEGGDDRGRGEVDALDGRPDLPEYEAAADALPEIWVPDTWDVPFEYLDGDAGVAPDAAACGNGLVDPGEECDDGDTDEHDECTTDCRFPRCGDGFIWYGMEDCDPPGSSRPCGTECGTSGNQGCNAYCLWDTACSPPRETCGNGVDDDCDGATDVIVREVHPVRISDHPLATTSGHRAVWTGSELAVLWAPWTGGLVLTHLDPWGTRVNWDADLGLGEWGWYDGPFWNGSLFGLFWGQRLPRNDIILFVPLDPDGWPHAPPVVVADDSEIVPSAHAACSDSACVLLRRTSEAREYTSEIGGPGHEYYALDLVAADGTFLGGGRVPGDYGFTYPLCVVWSGTEFLVLLGNSSVLGRTDLWLDHFTPDGTVVHTDVSDAEMLDWATCIWTGDFLGVVASTDHQLTLTLFDTDGRLVRRNVVLDDGSEVMGTVSMVAVGDELGMFWTDERDGNPEIYFTRFYGSGAFRYPEVRVTRTAGPSLAPAAVWMGDSYGVVWQDSDATDLGVYFTRFSLCP